MSIRKRTWTTSKGVEKTAWVADFTDDAGRRIQKMHPTQKAAKEYLNKVNRQMEDGVFVHDKDTITVKEAGEMWVQRARDEHLEASTVRQYEQHLRIHIAPFIGHSKLNKLTVPQVTQFRSRLQQEGRSRAMVRGVLSSLSSIITDAQALGYTNTNPVRGMRRLRSRGGNDERHKEQLVIGRDIPDRDEMRAIIEHAKPGRFKTLLMMAALTGLRASELRGLPWSNVDLIKGEVYVRQRADMFNRIGPPKSRHARRTVPLPAALVDQLEVWRKAQPKKARRSGLVFCNDKGNVDNLGNINRRALQAACLAAEIDVPDLDEDGRQKRDKKGQPLVKAKYGGLHSLRHFYASWLANPKSAGGLELPMRTVQGRLGHSSMLLTANTYSHLFPATDDNKELAAAADDLLGL